MNIIEKLLPPQIQKLLQDKELVKDLSSALTETENALATGAKDPGTDKKAKEAFTDVCSVISAGNYYLKNNSVPMGFMLKFSFNKNRLQKSFETLVAHFNDGHPATVAVSLSLKNNVKFNEASKKIAAKTHQKLFSLEDGVNGKGYVIELLTGKMEKFPLSKEAYEIARSFVDNGPKNPPAPPADRPAM